MITPSGESNIVNIDPVYNHPDFDNDVLPIGVSFYQFTQNVEYYCGVGIYTKTNEFINPSGIPDGIKALHDVTGSSTALYNS